ncbi:MAG TPA: phosphonate ABC transporter, permease protein PhnE [Solirubrobacteraceae bacterium]|nr:phosphonate ABC transporter, permease protein PhnE [Solirubrobacteraceae bacterium]
MSVSEAPGARVTAGAGPRWRRPSLSTFLLLTLALALAAHGFTDGAAVSPLSLVDGLSRTIEFVADAFPPDLGRLGPVAEAMLVTLEMALIGTCLGVVASVPLAVLGARNTTPHPLVHGVTRAAIAFLRSVPDLVWGIVFVVTVGLGPEAGVLAIAADTAGFCGRFFADRIEDVEPEVVEGLTATGATRGGVLAGGVLPSVLPSFVGTSMFALESATRSSVVLGVVGAGGIGVELTTSMQLLRYDEALTIILAIFVVVLGVERVAARIRRKVGASGEVGF